MLSQTKGIVLHFVKYSENSIITTFYTDNFGRLTCIIHTSGGKKSRNKINLLQPLFMVDMEIYYKQTRDVQGIKELKPAFIYRSIPFQIEKSTQAIFIAELLFRVLQEEECSPQLFDFLENSIQNFDKMEQGKNNFMLFFLIRLTEYLGFFPSTDFIKNSWFDLSSGSFMPEKPNHSKYLNPAQSEILKKLLFLDINELAGLSLNRNERKQILEKLVVYYKIHFEVLGELKSLPVLQEVFK